MSDKIRVVHCKKEKYDVYIGRPGRANASMYGDPTYGMWGNPFILDIDGNREEVLDKFEKFLRGHPQLLALAKEKLKGKVLGCWCAPEKCHGDIYKKIIEEEA